MNHGGSGGGFPGDNIGGGGLRTGIPSQNINQLVQLGAEQQRTALESIMNELTIVGKERRELVKQLRGGVFNIDSITGLSPRKRKDLKILLGEAGILKKEEATIIPTRKQRNRERLRSKGK